tara:strand:+ start:976 stop:1677 length:702 start_codon:yes stop_codon:yes gene_type:complete
MKVIQPWSPILCQSKVPEEILSCLQVLADNIINDPSRQSAGHSLVGQIVHEYFVDHQKMKETKTRGGLSVFDYFVLQLKEYVTICSHQCYIADGERQRPEDFLIQLQSVWVVNQKPGEYNPLHGHSGGEISTVCYLQIPEYIQDPKPMHLDEGAITWVGGLNFRDPLTQPTYKIQPQVGDIFNHSQTLMHTVHPYRSQNINSERRSFVLNSDFIEKNYMNDFTEHKLKMGEWN